jgi:hypothetical protein
MPDGPRLDPTAKDSLIIYSIACEEGGGGCRGHLNITNQKPFHTTGHINLNFGKKILPISAIFKTHHVTVLYILFQET